MITPLIMILGLVSGFLVILGISYLLSYDDLRLFHPDEREDQQKLLDGGLTCLILGLIALLITWMLYSV